MFTGLDTRGGENVFALHSKMKNNGVPWTNPEGKEMKIREQKDRREGGKEGRNDDKIHSTDKIPVSAMYGFFMETNKKTTFSTQVDKARGGTAFPGPIPAGRESRKT